jgi:hypothetical protein
MDIYENKAVTSETNDEVPIWDDYEHVIIDRKRRVVVFLDHPLTFEAFLERGQLDKYLDTIRPYMPPNTRYEERQWNE